MLAVHEIIIQHITQVKYIDSTFDYLVNNLRQYLKELPTLIVWVTMANADITHTHSVGSFPQASNAFFTRTFERFQAWILGGKKDGIPASSRAILIFFFGTEAA